MLFVVKHKIAIVYIMFFLKETLGVAEIDCYELKKANNIKITNFKDFIKEINKRKMDDHHASHSNDVNQFLHFLSSSLFIYCYAIMNSELYKAIDYAILSMVLRQSGHIIFEPPSHDKQKLQLGFNTRAKMFVLGLYSLTPVVYLIENDFHKILFIKTMFLVIGHTIALYNNYGFVIATVWVTKFFSDPFTDLIAYYPSLWRIFTTPDWKEAKKMHIMNHYLKN
tara:strand:+ start:410 stop:1081 length:672 start_codon:yes stop_codon:yes gene_type:complete